MSGIPWTELLGALGLESPGYQETLKDCRDNPFVKLGKRKPAKKKTGGKAKFPSAKHGSD